MRKNVMILTVYDFPNNDAGAVRDLMFAKIYSNLGWHVHVVGQGTIEGKGVYEGIQFESIYRTANSTVDKILRAFYYVTTLKEKIREFEIRYGQIDVFHITGYSALFPYLKKCAREKHSRLIFDCVEWYSPCEFKYGKLDKAYVLNNTENKYLLNKEFCVIAISSYLQKHFASKGIKTTRIPVIMDMEKGYVATDRKLDVVNITYAGSPAKKDLLEDIIKAFVSLNADVLEKLHLNVVGVSKEQIIENNMCTAQELKAVEEHITVYGRVPRERVLEILKDTDFSVLVRPALERYAIAGYPTKSVEAMMNSVAMLCNLSSDLGMYLRDGANAVLVEDESIEALKNGYIRISKMSSEEILLIRKNARKTAEEVFDYRLWRDAVREMLSV